MVIAAGRSVVEDAATTSGSISCEQRLLAALLPCSSRKKHSPCSGSRLRETALPRGSSTTPRLNLRSAFFLIPEPPYHEIRVRYSSTAHTRRRPCPHIIAASLCLGSDTCGQPGHAESLIKMRSQENLLRSLLPDSQHPPAPETSRTDPKTSCAIPSEAALSGT